MKSEAIGAEAWLTEIKWEPAGGQEMTINARAAFGNHIVKIRLAGAGRALWVFRLGAIFIRFGCWLANLGYEETD